MSDPLQYPSVTARHALPLLFPGQAQKEMFVNAALGRCDALLQPAIEGDIGAPPTNPEDGQGWLIADGATGEFAGRDGQVAYRQGGSWIFSPPRDGMRVLDLTTGQHVLFSGRWRREEPIAPPSGGTTVDSEAREVIGQLIAAISRTGILPEL